MAWRFFLLFFGFLILCPEAGWSQNYGQIQNNLQRNNNINKHTMSGILSPATGEGKGSRLGSSGDSFGAIDYQVHLLGQVQQPGTYRFPPSTRLDEAINKAGGILQRGSIRNVELRRDKKVYYYDLFKFEKQGDLNQNPFLLDNDVIFVPFSENTVVINGPVKSPGSYELTEDKSILTLLHLAGGYTSGVSQKESLTVVRYIDGAKTLIKIPNVEADLQNFTLQNGDVIIAPHAFLKGRRFDYTVSELPGDTMFYPTQKNEIYITGTVAKPGALPFYPNFSIRDFVNTAGVVELSNVRGLYVLTADGRYVRKPESKKDFYLSPGDTIFVPKKGWTTDNVLRWYNTFTGTIFTSFALKQLLQ